MTVTSSFDEQWQQTSQQNGQASSSIGSDSTLRQRGAKRPASNAASQNGLGTGGEGASSGGGFATQIKRRGVGPGVTAVFPRFSYPDVNFWIWVFGRRYRRVVRGWQASVTGPSKSADRR